MMPFIANHYSFVFQDLISKPHYLVPLFSASLLLNLFIDLATNNTYLFLTVQNELAIFMLAIVAMLFKLIDPHHFATRDRLTLLQHQNYYPRLLHHHHHPLLNQRGSLLRRDGFRFRFAISHPLRYNAHPNSERIHQHQLSQKGHRRHHPLPLESLSNQTDLVRLRQYPNTLQHLSQEFLLQYY